ncbi:MAG: hypothetical protein PHQ60_16080 [Sideroxydans sp.]|nr:hypothetical protein [Sideroxydans sp.]
MTKNRTLKILAALFALAAVYWFGLRDDPKVVALNRALHEAASPALRDFPYEFKVLRLDGETAVMSTPRSSEVPVYRMIGAIYPDLSGKASDNPDFVAAQMRLAGIQSEAREIVLKQPGVASVKWELDQNWLIAHNIPLH